MSDKVVETKKTVVDTADKTKGFGEDKAGDIHDKFEAANKEAEAQLNADSNISDTIKSDDPSFADKSKAKAAEAKEKAGNAGEKVTGAVTDGWNKTKETLSNLNQYPDKQ